MTGSVSVRFAARRVSRSIEEVDAAGADVAVVVDGRNRDTDVERQCVDHLPTSLIDVPADRRSADVLASLSRRRHVRRSL